MPSYKAPVRDSLFILNEVLELGRYAALPGFAELTPDTLAAVLEEGGRFAEEVIQPLNRSGDEQGCTRHADGRVTTPEGFKAAYEKFVAGGWGGLAGDPAFGGQGLPHAVATAFEEYMIAANMAFTMYPMLTQGAIAAIRAVATPEQQQKFIPKMMDGTWTGTMNLTEAHCGTDLGLLRTRAEAQADGTYRITGTKIFISSGEHDLTENIIHLVLAKLPDSPDSVKGISLFIVPKVLVDDAGRLGARNAVSCGRIEEKMGIHGNATCVMNYEGATGYLIGERDKGLRAMFIMMNAARLGVGVQGLAQSEVAYQNAAIYARERLQGRALSGSKNPAGKADPIIVHPDVRRMLMNARAFNEGARALTLWSALQVDLAEKAATPAEREAAEDLIGLLTPVIKAYFTDRGYAHATDAQQCYGGHGYIREWGMEQFVRDARIAMIYEGTNGIQALDLVGRKLPANGGRALRAYLQLVGQCVEACAADERTRFVVAPLKRALEDLQGATGWLMRHALMKPDNAAAGSMAFLHLLGLVALGHQWALMIRASLAALAKGAGEAAFYEHKLTTGRYYFSHVICETAVHRARVEAGAEPMMALPAEAF
ncbi:MAG TPA: acyl-CoA dehydrogenase C-terminal domain-containing protein [Gammaproteobacteria bacterium]|nr:acyl-CoA dehydrogenase C-terminal domain-containing protein [Gammaproteobacteria bacterium]